MEIAEDPNVALLAENIAILPFNRAVSKYNIEEDPNLDIITMNRKVVDYNISRLIRTTNIDQTARFLPIVADAGCGKTHYYWVLKSREESKETKIPYKTVYVSSPAVPYRLFHHIYTCLVEEIADERFFIQIMDILLEELNIDLSETNYTENPSFLIAKILPTFPGVFSDCIKALVYLRLKGIRNYQGALALRWLLGEGLTEEEQKQLQVHSILEQDDVCLAMIKIICDLSEKVLIFYFDEMESPLRSFGPEAQQKFFEYIKRMYNETRNSIIVSACLKPVWAEVLKSADRPTLQRMEPELYLDKFTFEDLKVFFIRGMSHFWTSLGKLSPKDIYFPLSESILKEIYDLTEGNQRECIKQINFSIEAQLDEYYDTLQKNRPGYIYTYKPPNTHLDQTYVINPETNQLELVDIPHESVDTGDEEELEPSPGNVFKVFFDYITKKFNDKKIKYDFIIDFSFKQNEKTKKIGAILKYGGLKHKVIGFEIPTIRSFEKQAGNAANFAMKRLIDALESSIIDYGILIVPDKPQGEKYQKMLTSYEHLYELSIPIEKVRTLLKSQILAEELLKEHFGDTNLFSF
ncbi:MAG: hypothetical protein JW776_16405 [Candidatus Lokiarchaeota archaeon]|nr:hypothetical protein [Candidatus Lokiarchaeota archaeon]